jgi:hypothetical protein
VQRQNGPIIGANFNKESRHYCPTWPVEAYTDVGLFPVYCAVIQLSPLDFGNGKPELDFGFGLHSFGFFAPKISFENFVKN